tara:strand:+ start:125 stop:292 length:168 start_codon:yes stop_codon:yes gene_type:complete
MLSNIEINKKKIDDKINALTLKNINIIGIKGTIIETTNIKGLHDTKFKIFDAITV